MRNVDINVELARFYGNAHYYSQRIPGLEPILTNHATLMVASPALVVSTGPKGPVVADALALVAWGSARRDPSTLR